jgi:hypothetical protein
LTDLAGKAKIIGLKKCVEILLPCLVECFNSDETIHPDIYDAHAHVLFNSMGPLIDFLAKEGRKKMPRKIEEEVVVKEQDELIPPGYQTKPMEKKKVSSSDVSSEASAMSDYSESDFGDNISDFGGMPEDKLTGYYGISVILLEQIYSEIF